MQAQIIGSHGKAWIADTKEGCRLTARDPNDDNCLVHWVTETPYTQPIAWHSLVLLQLRPDRPITYHLPNATHELWLCAIHPKADHHYLIRTGIPGPNVWLQPMVFASQLRATDEGARGRVHDAVILVCDAKLSPDLEFQLAWCQMFGDNMVNHGV